MTHILPPSDQAPALDPSTPLHTPTSTQYRYTRIPRRWGSLKTSRSHAPGQVRQLTRPHVCLHY
jgi:hypothetical protein